MYIKHKLLILTLLLLSVGISHGRKNNPDEQKDLETG